MSIELNVACRKMAQALLELQGEPQPHAFYLAMIDECKKHLPTPEVPATPVMSEARAAEFEKLHIPFGAYKYQSIRESPITYLINLCESPFIEQLRLYLKTEHCKRRIESEDSYDSYDDSPTVDPYSEYDPAPPAPAKPTLPPRPSHIESEG